MLVGNPYEVEFVTIASIIDKLRVKAQKTPADTWVENGFFDDTKVKRQARADPSRPRSKCPAQLPVMECSIAADTLPSTTARRCKWRGSTRTRPITPGGTFDRDANGDLTGRVTDLAREVFATDGRST